MTPRCTGKWLLVVVCLFGIRAAESLTCTVHLQGDGTALYKISEPAKPNWEADWEINGKVVANEDEFNETTVLKNTGNSYPNTTYTTDYAKGRVTVSCNGPAPISPSEAPHDANKRSRGAILAGGVIALLVLLSVGVCGCKKKGCFRKKEKEQGDPEASEQLNDDSSIDGML